ncbi:hypothetical protein GCM10023232_16120 [Sphingosinicella ginsenosidimutans]|uniref:Anti-sigma factor NepR domain-containing protein n=1 Tax=Allosphingosinicella ginsenosidimutans TaxID=1176539 RepID=A0A5C6TR79_9SPHN|nr:hypothetical protein FRZ32_02785 [Sphingosinicella ginsenosidimutans]
MSLQDDKDSTRRRKPATSPEGKPSARARRKPPSGDVGRALRSAYREVVEEDIPPEMIDLLGKLG